MSKLTFQFKQIMVHLESSELTNAILEKQPKNVFCGHIHSGKHGKLNLMEVIYIMSLD